MVPVNEVGERGPAADRHRQPAAGLERGRARDHRAADLLRRARQLVRRRRRPPAGVRLPDRRERRRRLGRHDHQLDRHERDPPRQHADAAPVRAALPRPGPAHQRPGHRRQPAALPSLDRRSPAAGSRRSCATTRTRTSSSARTAAWSTSRTRTPCPTGSRTRRGSTRSLKLGALPTGLGAGAVQLHPQQRQDHDGRLRRDDALLRRATRTIRSCGPTQGVFPTLFEPMTPMPGRPPAAPARARRAVQRPDPGVRPVSRDRTRSSSTAATTCGRCRRARRASRRCRPRPTTWSCACPARTGGVPPPPADGPERPAEHDRLDRRPQRRRRTTARPWSTASRPIRPIFGPAQIEARIDQDPAISAQISLWNQSGSEVIRGNLIVVPLDDSLIYLQPVYLQSTGSKFPDFQQIVVASPTPSSGATRSARRSTAASGQAGGPGPSPSPTPSRHRARADPGPDRHPRTGSVAADGDVPGLIDYANAHFELGAAGPA